MATFHQTVRPLTTTGSRQGSGRRGGATALSHVLAVCFALAPLGVMIQAYAATA